MTRPFLTIDPGMQFGRVCLNHTRTPADVVAECVFAGDPVDYIADAYGLTREDVLLACWWVTFDATVRPKSRRTASEQRLVERWGPWCELVHASLGGWSDQPTPIDPP